MRQLRALVDDLLDAARLEHGKLLVRTTSTSLNEIVVDAVTAVQHHFEARKHTLTLTGLDSPIHVRADHVRLSQVLGNILSNAAKYTPAEGVIELIARTTSSAATSDTEERLKTIEVTVRDNGIGIGPDILPHVFELFTQAPSSNARSVGGLGIGLAVAKRLVELHNGSITIDSRGAGRGTVVTVRLPIVVDDPKSSSPVRLDAAPLMQGTRLLLVDDNRDALDALSTLLELEGFQVLTSNTGQDAIRIVAEQLPDLAIVDIGMPVMDGFEVASIIRSHPELEKVVLIALTGYAAESDKSRALAAGFDYHFTKPLSLERLRNVLYDRRTGNSRRLV
jgi:CheY-like chemotaxis protein/two-component sensor histidine kinase